jgi:hypothetical protein
MQNFYVNQEHKDFCSGKQILLSKPIINKVITIRFNYVKTPVYGAFNVAMLDNVFKKAMYSTTKIDDNIMKILLTNYDRKVPFHLDRNVIDMQWFKRMNDYIKQLSYEQLFAVHGYISLGDNSYINGFLQNTLTMNRFRKLHEDISSSYKTNMYFPLFFPLLNIVKQNITSLETILINKDTKGKKLLLTYEDIIMVDFQKNTNKEELYILMINIVKYVSDDTILKCVKTLVETIQSAINGAPPTTKKMIVFSNNNSYVDNKKQNVYFKHKGFVTTSISELIASNHYDDNKCLSSLTLLPGTKTLWLEGIGPRNLYTKPKLEFLVGLNTTYLIRRHKVKKRLLIFHDNDICNKHNSKLVNTSEIVAL